MPRGGNSADYHHSEPQNPASERLEDTLETLFLGKIQAFEKFFQKIQKKPSTFCG
jgi:hypothetical protein